MKVSEPPSAPRRPSDGTWGRCHRGGRVMGRGAPRCPPPHFAIPPPQEQHFLGYVNARSRAPFRPRRPRGVGEMEGGGRGGDSLPVPNGQPCPQHAATGTMAAGHPDTAPPAPRHLPAPPRRGAAACTRARGQPAPRPWHGGTPGRALPAACGWIWGGWGLGRGGGVLGSAAPTLGCSRLLLHSRGTSQPQWGE